MIIRVCLQWKRAGLVPMQRGFPLRSQRVATGSSSSSSSSSGGGTRSARIDKSIARGSVGVTVPSQTDQYAANAAAAQLPTPSTLSTSGWLLLLLLQPKKNLLPLSPTTPPSLRIREMLAGIHRSSWLQAGRQTLASAKWRQQLRKQMTYN